MGSGADDAFPWMLQQGIHGHEIERLLPTLPGGLTTATSYYVNSALPGVVFRGREQGSIPMTPGLWYLIPSDVIDAHPAVREVAQPLATAAGMQADAGPRAIADWPTGE